MLPATVGAQPASPSPYVQDVWTVKDGLPVNSINAIVQTRDGYIWLATYDGLVRFDGVRFTVFDTGNAEGLPSSRIIDLIEDHDGSLWLRTEQAHLVRFKDGVFTHYGPEDGLVGTQAHVLYQDAEGILWVGSDRGTSRLRDGRLEPFAEELLTVLVKSLHRDRSGALWVGTWAHGLHRVKDGVVATFTTENGLTHNEVIALFEAADGTLWIGTRAGLNSYRDGRLAPLIVDGAPGQDLASREINVLYEDARGMLWIGTDNGLYQYQDNRIRQAGSENKVFTFPKSVQTDPAGHVWFALGNMLYRDEQPVFQLSSSLHDDELPVPKIRTFLHDREGSVWVGTHSSGLYRLKPSLFTVYSEPEGVAYKNIYSIYEDRSGTLWFGTYGRGLSRLYRGVITNYTPRDGMPHFVLSIHEDRKGTLWVGTLNSGVCQFRDDSCTPFGATHIRSGSNVYVIQEDRAGALWFGTDDGLYRYRDSRDSQS